MTASDMSTQLLGAQREQFRPGMVCMMSGPADRGGADRPATSPGFLNAPGDQRDVEDVGVHRRDGEEADEPVLDDLPPEFRNSPHHHDVRVGAVAQEAGHGGLRQHHRVAGLAEFGQHLGPQARNAEPAGLFGTAVPSATVQRWAPSRMKLLSSQRSGGDVHPVQARKWLPSSAASLWASASRVLDRAAESSATCRASATTIGSSRTASPAPAG